jgi:hypothetical protein
MKAKAKYKRDQFILNYYFYDIYYKIIDER